MYEKKHLFFIYLQAGEKNVNINWMLNLKKKPKQNNKQTKNKATKTKKNPTKTPNKLTFF